MNTPTYARDAVRSARIGGTLRKADWDLIEDFLSSLILRGVGKPGNVLDRLERRGVTTFENDDDDGGRRNYDPSGDPSRCHPADCDPECPGPQEGDCTHGTETVCSRCAG